MDGWLGGCGLTELWAQGYFGKKAPEKTFPELEKLVRTSINLGSFFFTPYLAFGCSCKLFELQTKRDLDCLQYIFIVSEYKDYTFDYDDMAK